MRPSKDQMLRRINSLEEANAILSSRVSDLRGCISRQEQLLDELAELQGYRVVHKNGYYLEPVVTKPEEPYGN